MKGESTASPRQVGASVAQAFSLIDQAIPATSLERQARIGAEVLRRTLIGDVPGALEGAQNLVRLLADDTPAP